VPTSQAGPELMNFAAVDCEGRRDIATSGGRSRWVDLTAEVATSESPVGGDDPRTSDQSEIPISLESLRRRAFSLLNSSLTLDEPYRLVAHERLRLRYRVLAHRGRPDPVQAEPEDYSASSPEGAA
jgi:hypothetical protein